MLHEDPSARITGEVRSVEYPGLLDSGRVRARWDRLDRVRQVVLAVVGGWFALVAIASIAAGKPGALVVAALLAFFPLRWVVRRPLRDVETSFLRSSRLRHPVRTRQIVDGVPMYAAQPAKPVVVAVEGRRSWWLHRDRIFWTTDDLSAEDVLLLIEDRERKARRKLDHIRAVSEAEKSLSAVGERQPIPREVKIAVWERCGGRCAECGASAPLQYDHVIPIAMGGSNNVNNLQLLCDRCNQAKGGTLG